MPASIRRLLSLVTVLVGKILVGAFSGIAVALVPLLAGMEMFHFAIADPVLLTLSRR